MATNTSILSSKSYTLKDAFEIMQKSIKTMEDEQEIWILQNMQKLEPGYINSTRLGQIKENIKNKSQYFNNVITMIKTIRKENSEDADTLRDIFNKLAEYFNSADEMVEFCPYIDSDDELMDDNES